MSQLPTVYISVGGNINPRLHIKNALQKLKADFGTTTVSSVYESKSVGFEGDNFLNLVVSFQSTLSVGLLNQYLHDIEDAEGRERLNGKAWDSRTLDLDIVLYGNEIGTVEGVELPRDEILEHAHVLLPLAEIAGTLVHEPTQKTYRELQKGIDFSQQEIWTVQL